MGKSGLIVRGCGMGRETGLVHYCLSSLVEPRNDTAVGGGPRGWADVTDWQYGVLPPLILREPPASADLRQHERPSPKAITRDCHYGGGDGFRLGGRNDGRKSGREEGEEGGLMSGRGTGMMGEKSVGWCRVTMRCWHCRATPARPFDPAQGERPLWGWIHVTAHLRPVPGDGNDGGKGGVG